jgi:hypothetical protein
MEMPQVSDDGWKELNGQNGDRSDDCDEGSASER